ncbi:hypothetical protein KIN20_028674 [Parelaphostrongylus tenuis]|uniref:Uncharacterized protein n=1 Tax=Parelaphostrongylus tenuis TaxID=148309 RepID=A0AAD5R1Y0_PARTN|nr:hypothetical protein KIN20_028674 [Parelaphostrongylus tenuis]
MNMQFIVNKGDAERLDFGYMPQFLTQENSIQDEIKMLEKLVAKRMENMDID